MGPYQSNKITWEGIAIEIRWNPTHYRGDDCEIAHLELHTEPRQRLPMTETGYRSHFVHREQVESHGGPVPYVEAWLAHDARSREWKRYVEQSKQMSLF